MIRHSAVACASLVLLALVVPSSDVRAGSDWKTIHGSQCLPRGPGTTASELTIGAYGIANPGETDETVICAIPVDNEHQQVGSNELWVRYRAGTVPGRISCTVFTGAVGAQDEPVTSYSAMSALQAANSPSTQLALAIPTSTWSGAGAAVVSVACTLSPKVKIGSLILHEYGDTNTPTLN
jgi:hypothetical protein